MIDINKLSLMLYFFGGKPLVNDEDAEYINILPKRKNNETVKSNTTRKPLQIHLTL